jgi:GNAT superfamily N-acetyltransferase
MLSAPLARIDKARALLQQGQYAELLDQVSSRVLPAGNPILYWDRFVIVGLDPGQVHPPERRLDSLPVPASPEDLEAIRRARPERAALVQRRLEEGQRCFVIHDEGKVVARQWVVGDQPAFPTNSDLRFVPPTRPALWCHDIFVEPAYRKRGFFASLMLNTLSVLTIGPGQQPPHLYGEIHFLNHASLRAHLRLGYRVIQTVTVISVLGWKVFRSEDDRGHATLHGHHAWRVRHI